MAVTSLDPVIAELVRRSDHKLLGTWAADCAERALPYFESKYPADARPRQAIDACRAWVRTGIFKMADVRGASFAAHAAARDTEDAAARAAARAAGQAVATAHVATHAIAAAIYAATAVRDAAALAEAAEATLNEREWQHRHLLALTSKTHLPT